jgi:hypothetical protein
VIAAEVVYLPTPGPAPERPLTVGVHLVRDPSSPSGWTRRRITTRELELLRRGTTPILTSWDQLDLTSTLFADGAVVLDRVSL